MGEPDFTVRLVGSGEQADQVVGVVGDQVITATPADVGKVVTVAADGSLVLAAAGGGGGVSDHGALTGLGDDDHPYVLETLIDAPGDLFVGTAADTVGRLAKGAALDALRVNAAGTALEWASPWVKVVDKPGTSLTDWTVVAGTWAANAGGYIEQTNTAAAYYGLVLNADVYAGAAFAAEAEVRFPAGATARRGMIGPATRGVVATTSDPWAGPAINPSTVYVHRGDQEAVNDARTVAADTWYRCRVTLLGSFLTVEVDGVMHSTYRVTSGAGLNVADRLMLVNFTGPAHYRNIKAWRLAGPA